MTSKSDRIKSKIVRGWEFVSRFLIVLCIIYFYPYAKNILFPNQMTRFENMLRQSSMDGYHLVVDRKSVSEINLSVFNGAQSITTEIYRDVMRELAPVGDKRVFFSHAINSTAEGVTYLSRTRIETDSKLKSVKHLEVTVCGHIKGESGQVGYDGHEPVYECEVPILEIKCKAAKQPDPYRS